MTFREKPIIIAPIQNAKAMKRRVRPSQLPQRVPVAEKGRRLDRRKMASEPRTDGGRHPHPDAADPGCDGVRPLKR